MRPLVHSYAQLLWTDVSLQQQDKKVPQHDFVSRSTAASTLCDVQVHAADPTGLVATIMGRPFEKNTHTLLNDTVEKNMAVSSPTATLSETKNNSSIQHQKKLEDQKHATAFPLLTPFHSRSSRCIMRDERRLCCSVVQMCSHVCQVRIRLELLFTNFSQLASVPSKIGTPMVFLVSRMPPASAVMLQVSRGQMIPSNH